jgi:hypothetical protein
MTKSERAANWQKNIQGSWHGMPSVFDADGNHMGWIKVSRSSVERGGVTTYYMDTEVDVGGSLRARFEASEFAFGVGDVDGDRVYLGPDFVGAGHPYGSLVDAHYYSPGWMTDLRTMVHVLADGRTQVYSSLLYEGPTIVAVFNGLYRMANDYGINPDTTGAIDRFVTSERAAGRRPHVLPFKHAGRWTGELAVHDPSGAARGAAAVSIGYRPTSLLRAEVELEVTGDVELSARFTRARNGNRHTFEGPDLYGNGIGYGRALYTSQHLYGRALKIRGRDFLLDDDHGLSACWQLFESDRLVHTLYGCLSWQPAEQVLTARY